MKPADLAKYLDLGQPLGPLASEKITDPELFRILSDENPPAYKFAKPRPSVIIGRRGAGKTGYLMTLKASSEYPLAIFIRPGDAFERTVARISPDISKINDSTVETISDYWSALFYLCALHEFNKNHRNHRNYTVASFRNEYTEISATVADFLQGVQARISAATSDGAAGSIASIIRIVMSGIANDVDELGEKVEDLLSESNTKCLIMMDTLEDSKVHDPRYKAAIQGLFRAAGYFNSPNRFLEIRITMPGEMYRKIDTFSSNLMKDFDNYAILQWHAGDLVSLSAQRYATYLYSQNILASASIHAELEKLSTRGDAVAFFESIFPKLITNGFGKKEKPIAYILRHTQLLPRQILYFLAEVIVIASKRNERPNRISEESIMLALKKVKTIMVSEICQAFEPYVDNVKDMASFLKNEMPRNFNEEEFRQAYVKSKAKYRLYNNINYNEALQLLMEIGAVGKKIEETEYYNVANFAYVGSSSVGYTDGDEFCIHPIFNGVPLAELKTRGPLPGKPIYPYGSDPEADDGLDHTV